MNDLRSQKTPIESLFIEATEKFRSNLKTMYSVPVRAAQPRGGAPRQPPPLPSLGPAISPSYGRVTACVPTEREDPRGLQGPHGELPDRREQPGS